MITIIEIPKTDQEELLEQDFLSQIDHEIIEPKKLIGAEEVIQWAVDLTSATIPVIAGFLIARKERKKVTRIIIDGIAIEYSSKEELEEILQTLNEEKN